MMYQANLPHKLWADAIRYAAWLKNRIPTKVLGDTTPFKKLYGQKPNLAGLPEWGQWVWVHNPSGSKLDARATQAHWVGYDGESTHAHRIYWHTTNTVSIECNIKFVKEFINIGIQPDTTQEPSVAPQPQPTELQPAPSSTPQQVQEQTPQPAKPQHSEWSTKPSELMCQIQQGEFTTGEDADSNYSIDDDRNNVVTTLIENIEDDPKSLSEAQSRDDWHHWKAAMDCEMTTLDQAGMWSNIPKPTNENIIRSKWVFCIKKKADSTIEKYKVRLVARGFIQVYRVDYLNTYSPVARFTTT